MKNILWFTVVFVAIIFSLLFAIVSDNVVLQLILKIIFPFLLGTTYLLTVSKKRASKLYLLLIFFISLGEIFLIDSYQYFEYIIFIYVTAHILFTINIYNFYLRNESKFDVFTFSLPFLLTFSIIYILYDVNYYWSIQVVSLGVVACVNASTVLLNYANSRTQQNYLFFLGMFLWLLADSFGGVYRFKNKEIIFHVVSVFFDLVAQYLICIAFMLDVKKDEVVLEK